MRGFRGRASQRKPQLFVEATEARGVRSRPLTLAKYKTTRKSPGIQHLHSSE